MKTSNRFTKDTDLSLTFTSVVGNHQIRSRLCVDQWANTSIQNVFHPHFVDLCLYVERLELVVCQCDELTIVKWSEQPSWPFKPLRESNWAAEQKCVVSSFSRDETKIHFRQWAAPGAVTTSRHLGHVALRGCSLPCVSSFASHLRSTVDGAAWRVLEGNKSTCQGLFFFKCYQKSKQNHELLLFF